MTSLVPTQFTSLAEIQTSNFLITSAQFSWITFLSQEHPGENRVLACICDHIYDNPEIQDSAQLWVQRINFDGDTECRASV